MCFWLVIRRLPVWPRRVGNILSWRFDHEIFSIVILSLLLIQEGQLSVSGKRIWTILDNHLEELACPVQVMLGELIALDMTLLGRLGHKTSTQIMFQSKQNKWSQRTNGPVAYLKLFVLSKMMVITLKTEIYGYGSQQFKKNLWSLYHMVTWYGI